MRALPLLTVSGTKVIMCSLPKAAEPVDRLVRLVHRLAQLLQIRTPLFVDLPLGVGHDLVLIVRVHHLEVVHMRAVVDISVDGGLLIFRKSGVGRRSPDDEGPQGVNADLDAPRNIEVLHRPDLQHLADLALKERDKDCASGRPHGCVPCSRLRRGSLKGWWQRRDRHAFLAVRHR